VAGIVIVPHVVIVSPGETTNNVSVSIIIVNYDDGGKPVGITSGNDVGTYDNVIVYVGPDNTVTTADDGTVQISSDGTEFGTFVHAITADVESI
jgi:hypothetical protein